MAHSQVAWGVNALGGEVTKAAWKTKPSWYLVATDDKMIPPDAQRFMSKRAGAKRDGESRQPRPLRLTSRAGREDHRPRRGERHGDGIEVTRGDRAEFKSAAGNSTLPAASGRRDSSGEPLPNGENGTKPIASSSRTERISCSGSLHHNLNQFAHRAATSSIYRPTAESILRVHRSRLYTVTRDVLEISHTPNCARRDYPVITRAKAPCQYRRGTFS